MAATLIFKDKFIYADGAIREMVIWKLPAADPDRPHGLKYRLYYGYPNHCLVRYDNEKVKGDHRHWNEKETSYEFESVEKLVDDFKNDIAKLRGTS